MRTNKEHRRNGPWNAKPKGRKFGIARLTGRTGQRLLLGALVAVGLVLGAVVGWLVAGRGTGIAGPLDGANAQTGSITVAMGVCSYFRRDNCVVDGDTFYLRGEKVRIADIDTPELSPPRCEYERELGERAKLRLRELMNAGAFDLARTGDRDTDQYGRSLRIVERNGASLGDVLVREGLARRWTGHREPWC